jgi:uncharacterized membrane protein
MTDDRLAKAESRRSVLQLSRLETLTDVVYGIALWRVFTLIPRPWDTEVDETVLEYLRDGLPQFVLVIIALVMITMYWIQNNSMNGLLKKTDGKHTALSIVQLFSVLLFLFALRSGIDLGGDRTTRALESLTAALMGYTAAWAWAYAIKNRRLLHDEVTDEVAAEKSRRILAEPLTATITLIVAFVGPILWEASWFTYPVVLGFLTRRAAKK